MLDTKFSKAYKRKNMEKQKCFQVNTHSFSLFQKEFTIHHSSYNGFIWTGLPEAISVNEILSDKKLQAENRYVQVSETHNIHK